MNNLIITQRIEALRNWMREQNLTAYIFPSTDPHVGEYVPDHWKTREWISGFTGSAGTAVVTLTRAALWTDSRYWLAAEEQTASTTFEVIRCGRNLVTPKEVAEWLTQEKGEGLERGALGMDGWTMPDDYAEELDEQLQRYGWGPLRNVTFQTELWTNRPAQPLNPIEIQPLELSGRSAAEKLADIRASLTDANSIVITQLDEIAWTLNLRGSDIHCTPVFVSYLVVLPQKAILYVNPAQLTPEVEAYLRNLNVSTRPYNSIAEDLLLGNIDEAERLQYDPSVTNRTLAEAIRQEGTRVFFENPSPVPALRAIKNEAEIAGFRRAMLKDGVAMVKFLRWLEEQLPSLPRGEQGEGPLTEISIDRKLTALRAEQPGFRDISFDTIAGYGSHAAIVHYEATPETDVPLEPHGLLLLDSGAQYVDGTTDITRTIALGSLTDEERRDYTLVLKGHIRLATAVFPEGTTGTQLDVLARYAMWQDHKNYGHGTGHGVGSYLNVHEGPHQFRMNYVPAPLQAGMTVTIEPGIYIAGSHGVRIENTMLIADSPPALPVREGAVTGQEENPSKSPRKGRPADAETANGNHANACSVDSAPSLIGRAGGEPSWLRLEPLTLCPIDTTPIVRELMLPDEIDYLNYYHARVREALLPLLDDEQDRAWLMAHTTIF